jgi:hypothetical protein
MLRMLWVGVAVMLCLTACQGREIQVRDPRATARPDTATHLTADGWGPLRIGMTQEEVIAAAGADANPEAVGGPDPEQCDEFRPTHAPEGMIVMIERGFLTRISLGAGSTVKTDRGFGVGDTADAIKRAYGTAIVTAPHHYAPAPAEYITIWSTASGEPNARGLVYEIGADGRVMHVRAGGPSIAYAEGCV